CHLVRAPLPSSDYTTDTRTVLDSSVRILQALVDVAAYQGCVRSTLAAIELMQAVKQACMPDRSPLAQLSPDLLRLPSATDAPRCLGDLMVLNDTRLRSFFAPLATADSPADAVDSWCRAVRSLPAVDVVVDRQARPVAQSQSSSTVSLDELRPLTQYSVTVTVRYAAVRTEFARAKMLKEPGQAYSPRFGKTQYEGWWLMLVHPAAAANDELLAIKRLSMQGRDQKGSGMRVQTRSTSLMFITPEVAGSYALTLHLASDAYLGLDQELTVNLTVVDDAQMVVPKDPSAFLTKDQIGKYQ
ncbi:activating signal cointegrator 1 complex subunit 3, partial [Coemansia sp. RSA 2607]